MFGEPVLCSTMKDGRQAPNLSPSTCAANSARVSPRPTVPRQRGDAGIKRLVAFARRAVSAAGCEVKAVTVTGAMGAAFEIASAGPHFAAARTRIAHSVFGSATPVTGRPIERCAACTAALVSGPKSPSTFEWKNPSAVICACSVPTSFPFMPARKVMPTPILSMQKKPEPHPGGDHAGRRETERADEHDRHHAARNVLRFLFQVWPPAAVGEDPAHQRAA